jgi:hypothetical protein
MTAADWLTLFMAGVVAFAVGMYVVLDGLDLGVGILFPFADDDAQRDQMMNSIAPFWDGNETWLVLGGAILLSAFPLAFAVIMPAVYLPIIVMLLGLIFRGVAFEFRFKHHPGIWGVAFAMAMTATFAQVWCLAPSCRHQMEIFNTPVARGLAAPFHGDRVRSCVAARRSATRGCSGARTARCRKARGCRCCWSACWRRSQRSASGRR